MFAPGGGVDNQPVTTIKVSNLPAHVTESEFNCWFIFAQGFEQATLAPSRGPQGQQSGWARFSTVDSAQQAAQYLNGASLSVDMSRGTSNVLEAVMANKNFKPKSQARQMQDQGYAQQWGGQDQWGGGYGGGYDMGKGYDGGKGYGGGKGCGGGKGYSGSQWGPPEGKGGGKGPGTPINTIFVWKLQPQVTEEELAGVIQQNCPGFERLKFVAPTQDGKLGQCFVKFDNAANAERGLYTLRGTSCPSSAGDLMQVNFAKSELDMPKGTGGGPRGFSGASSWGPPPPVATPRGEHLPCDTMYIGNIGAAVTEEELSGLLSYCPGFEKLKYVPSPQGKGTAFAQFQSPEGCREAMQALHNTTLPSAPGQTIACQFAKNSLGKTHRTM
eukprot:TRINITY_DN3661_c0_g1_i1.p1 TRINITY_DN3661_c0_g1~~TRINITY_DN3661_c0_g1_i1.p1  ORF type:complete len:385 (+),score=108.00 TRINITY_DN3661_c0_g1_i1:70-1224(+)